MSRPSTVIRLLIVAICTVRAKSARYLRDFRDETSGIFSKAATLLAPPQTEQSVSQRFSNARLVPLETQFTTGSLMGLSKASLEHLSSR